jgi:hypothetical protein
MGARRCYRLVVDGRNHFAHWLAIPPGEYGSIGAGDISEDRAVGRYWMLDQPE